jgi:hypothetical protein
VDHPATIYPPSHQAFLTSVKKVRFNFQTGNSIRKHFEISTNSEPKNHAYVSTLHVKFREKLTYFVACVKKTKIISYKAIVNTIFLAFFIHDIKNVGFFVEQLCKHIEFKTYALSFLFEFFGISKCI